MEKIERISRALDRAELRFETFFMMAPCLLCIANPRGYLIHVNPAWTKLLGWTEEEISSRPYIDFVHPDDVFRTRAVARQMGLPDGEAISHFINRYRDRDGKYHFIKWTCSIFINGLAYALSEEVAGFSDGG